MFIRSGLAIPSFAGDRPYVRVGIRDEQGTLGIGEATPWPAESADSIAKMATAIAKALPQIGKVDLDNHLPIEAVSAVLAPFEGSLANTARFAIEMALLDIIGQRFRKPLAACLTAFDGHEQVPCNALLDAATDDLPQRAGELTREGFTAIKVKLRARDASWFAREVETLRAMRQVWHGELRLDPNGAWTIDEARQKLDILAEFAPHYVEQPVAAERLGDLGQTACPWAADESLLVPGLPERLAKAGHCAAFILKPALLGGFSKALALASLAKSAGIATITTHALDGPVGIAAAVEFARSISGPARASGLALHAGLSRYPSLVSPHHVCPGMVKRTSLPGLGFTEEDRERWITTD